MQVPQPLPLPTHAPVNAVTSQHDLSTPPALPGPPSASFTSWQAQTATGNAFINPVHPQSNSGPVVATRTPANAKSISSSGARLEIPQRRQLNGFNLFSESVRQQRSDQQEAGNRERGIPPSSEQRSEGLQRTSLPSSALRPLHGQSTRSTGRRSRDRSRRSPSPPRKRHENLRER